MKRIFELTYWGNSVKDYLVALLVMVGIILAVRLFRSIALNRLKKLSEKTDNVLDDLMVRMLERSVLPLLNVLAFYAASNYLMLPARFDKYFKMAIAVVVTYYVVRFIIAAIQQTLHAHLERQENAEEKKKQVKSLMVIVKIFIWLLGILFLFDNLGFDITAIVTGLGIGGIAIALAAQTILGDLFSYFVIFFDRPFEIGDMIVVDDKRGTVEYIGLKTTRIRSLTGEQLVIANTNLTNSRLHNFKKLERRRIVVELGVVYSTPPEKLKRIPTIIRGIIEPLEHTTFDRAHFATYGPYSLLFEVVYFIDSDDYQLYMDTQQTINLAIYEAFAAEHIEFAFPTQHVLVENLDRPKAGS
jgi:small-conductance mechanosensitive channel